MSIYRRTFMCPVARNTGVNRTVVLHYIFQSIAVSAMCCVRTGFIGFSGMSQSIFRWKLLKFTLLTAQFTPPTRCDATIDHRVGRCELGINLFIVMRRDVRYSYLTMYGGDAGCYYHYCSDLLTLTAQFAADADTEDSVS